MRRTPPHLRHRKRPSARAFAAQAERLDLRPPEPRALLVETDDEVDMDGEPRTSWHWTSRAPGKPA